MCNSVQRAAQTMELEAKFFRAPLEIGLPTDVRHVGGQGNLLDSAHRIDLTSADVREGLRANALQLAFPPGSPRGPRTAQPPPSAGAGASTRGGGGAGTGNERASERERERDQHMDKSRPEVRPGKLDGGGGVGEEARAAGGQGLQRLIGTQDSASSQSDPPPPPSPPPSSPPTRPPAAAAPSLFQ
jgi:hypothetical protein